MPRRSSPIPRALADSLTQHGLRIVPGGTDAGHLMLVDLTAKDVTGKAAEKGLDRAWLTCNKNGIPYDKRSPFVASGIRLGAPTSAPPRFPRGGIPAIGQLIAEVVDGMARNGEDGDGQVEQRVRARVEELLRPLRSIRGSDACAVRSPPMKTAR